jgi:hypothetical protein
LDGDANFTRLKVASGLSIRRFPRSVYTYRYVFWPLPVVRRCFLKDQASMRSTTVTCHPRWLQHFSHIPTLFGVIRAGFSILPASLHVIRDGYVSSTMVPSLPASVCALRDGYISFTHTPANFSSHHTILTCNYMYAWYCFCLASRGHGVLIFGVPVLFLHSGARGVGGPVCRLGGRASFKGGVFGFASVVVFCCVLAKSQHFIPDPPAEREERSRNHFLHNMKNITKPQVRGSEGGSSARLSPVVIIK